MSDSGEWVTFEQAKEIIGCARGTVSKFAAQGRFERRETATRWLPSLGRESVEQVAKEWKAQRRAKRRASLAREKAKTTGRRTPDDEHVWLTLTEAAAVIGVSRTRIHQLVQADRLPATRLRSRWWFRREHVEIYSAARAFQTVKQAHSD